MLKVWCNRKKAEGVEDAWREMILWANLWL